MATKKRTSSRKYSAPALEKGLDILELLSTQSEGVSQAQVAQMLNRSSGVLFRMLDCLERRGYIRRDPSDDLYRLTSRLYELAHRHPPTNRLLEIALPVMRHLAESVSQSCHIGVYHEGDILIVGEICQPGFIGFSVQPGARVPLQEAASGLVLLAYQSEETRQEWLNTNSEPLSPAKTKKLLPRLNKIREHGYIQQESHVIQGVTDIACPIIGPSGNAFATLSVPCMLRRQREVSLTRIRERAVKTAATISKELGGSPANIA